MAGGKSERDDDIAVIGMSCRFPDAPDVGSFWANLWQGRDSIREIGTDFWSDETTYVRADKGADPERKNYLGVLTGIDRFDHEFFNISPREAVEMDPQHRLLLEEAWRAIEDSGVPLDRLQRKSTALYAGAGKATYNQRANISGRPLGRYTASGELFSVLAARVSFRLGLRGPSLVYDTACSSSLVALHEAKELLRLGRCDYALVAGIRIHHDEWEYESLAAGHLYSPEGKCKTFDVTADGYVPGDGVGAVLLQPLAKARKEHNRVLAVIKGSAVNHTGASVSLTTPSVEGQFDVIRRAIRDARISPATLTYLEAHGTGTFVGDPIEIEALTRAFRKGTADRRFCFIGSVKTNIGHLETAAGIAGFIKILLMMRHRRIPPSLHVTRPNPTIVFEETPFRIADRAIEWRPRLKELPLRAGISSFGFSGSNAHALIEEAPKPLVIKEKSAVNSPLFFTLSAKTKPALSRYLERWREFVKSDAFVGADLRDLCATQAVGRGAMPFRVGFSVRDKPSLVADLQQLSAPEQQTRSGHWQWLLGDCQWSGYAQVAPAFGEGTLLNRALKPVQAALKKLGYPKRLDRFQAEKWKRADRPLFSFVAGYAYLQTLIDLGCSPHALAGHGNGFRLSLALSGCLSLEAILAELLGSKKDRVRRCQRPKIALFDTISGEWLQPFRLDAGYLNSLLKKLEFSAEQLTYYLDLAGRHHPNFRRMWSMWDRDLKGLGWTTASILRDPSLATGGSRHRRLLVLLSLVVSLRQFNRKWGISEHLQITDPHFCELLDLVSDQVLTKKDVVALLGEEKPQLKAIAAAIGPRQERIDRGKPYAFLRKHGRFLELDRKINRWIRANRKAQPILFPPEKRFTFVFGSGFKTFLKAQVRLENDDFASRALAETPLALWLHGAEVAWHRLYPKKSFHKVELPTYPFEPHRFWVFDQLKETAQGSLELAGGANPGGQPQTVAPESITPIPWLLPRLRLTPHPRKRTGANRALILAMANNDWATRLLSDLTQEAVAVEIRHLADAHTPCSEADLGQRCDELVAELPSTCKTLYYLVALEKLPNGSKFPTRDVLGLAALANSLVRQGRSLELKVLTQGALMTPFETAIGGCGGAALIGFCRGLALESPGLQVSCIDLDPTWTPNHLPSNWVARLIAEVPSEPWSPVLWRGSRRLQENLVRFEPSSHEGQAIRAGAVYLIFGGSGGIGRALGTRLAANEGAKIVWLGRRVEPDGPLPVGVDYWQCDLSDRAAVTATIQAAVKQFGAIHGIFHSADAPYSALAGGIDLNRLEAGLAVKTVGAVNLAHATQDLDLDFLVFFSSLASVFAVRGGSCYSAANAFVAAYAQELNRSRPYPVKVIDWGVWRDIGLANAYQDRHALVGMEPFAVDAGLDACLRVLASPFSRAMPLQASPDFYDKYGIPNAESSPAIAQPLLDEVVGLTAEMDASDERYLEEGLTQLANLDKLAVQRLAQVFQEAGVVGEALADADQLGQSIGVVGRYRPLLKALRAMLAELDFSDHRFGSVQAELMETEPAYLPYLKLADRCMANLLSVLRGTRSAIEVLFPGGSTKLVEPIYRDNPHSDVYNRTLARVMTVFSRATVEKAPCVLEVGAGTGGGSAAVLETLARIRPDSEYWYTDVSRAFTQHGQTHFGDHLANMVFRTLDIERAVESQGFEIGYFDAVLATNVVHAVKDVEASLVRLKRLLKKNGLLILNEITSVSELATLTFGLTDGWWAFSDPWLRQPNAPLLSPSGWCSLLESLGFRTVVLHQAGEGELARRQHVIVAQSDGVLFQPEAHALPRSVDLEIKPTEMVQTKSVLDKPEDFFAAASERLAALFAQVLDQPSIDPNRDYIEYGVDSLTILELNRQLSRHISDLETTVFFECRNLKQLTEILCRQYETAMRIWIERAPSPKKTAQAKVESAATSIQSVPVAISSDADPNPMPTRESEPIAIVGLSGRYPGAADTVAFWENLKAGKNLVTEVPSDRWDWQQYYHPKVDNQPDGSIYGKWGGFLTDIDAFDPLFFNISPKEAKQLDPQARLFLEIAWEALEDAGYAQGKLVHGKHGEGMGVFVGVTSNNYQWLAVEEWGRERRVPVDAYFWSLANRVSHVFNLTGPSMPVDTACSSSLAAIHQACRSLTAGECESALVGGVNLYLHPARYHSLCRNTMLSADGTCRGFGQGAAGFVPGEGVGAVLLTPLSKALRDRATIHGVIRGSSINHGGRTNGFTVPNPRAQGALISKALASSKVDPRSIGYIEAHGTGTLLGDPIEITGLTQAFRDYTQDRGFCAIGTVKSNIGHLESAAGIAAVTKVLLQMRHRTLVPSLHTEQLNPHIDFAGSPFVVQRDCAVWRPTQPDQPLRAGISSFGAGGLNVHLILESYSPAKTAKVSLALDGGRRWIAISAKDESRLDLVARSLADFLEAHGQDGNLQLDDVAFSLARGREAFAARLVLAVASLAELTGRLRLALTETGSGSGFWRGVAPSGATKTVIEVNQGDWQAAAMSWVAGATVDWSRQPGLEQARLISLPTYPFERDSYWLTERRSSQSLRHPLLREQGASFRLELSSSGLSLHDHRVGGRSLMPGAGYCELAIAAITARRAGQPYCLANLVFERPLSLSDCQDVQVSLVEGPSRSLGFRVHDEQDYCSAVLQPCDRTAVRQLDLVAIRARCSRPMSSDEVYSAYRAMEIDYGPAFRGMRNLWCSESEALAEVEGFSGDGISDYYYDPALIDSALQSAIGLMGLGQSGYLPIAVDRIQWLAAATTRLWAYAKLIDKGALARIDIDLCDEHGVVWMRFQGMSLRLVETKPAESQAPAVNFCYRRDWRLAPLQEQAAGLHRSDEKIWIVAPLKSHEHLGGLVRACRPAEVVRFAIGPKADQGDEWDNLLDEAAPDTWAVAFKRFSPPSVVYFVALRREVSATNPQALEETWRREQMHAPLHLIKALSVIGFAQGKGILKLIANNGIAHGAPDRRYPGSALLSGLAKTIAREYPALRVANLDIDGGELRSEKLAAALVAEPADDPTAGEVLLRAGKRYRARLCSVRLPAAVRNPFREHGTYVILGGARGIGFAFAGYLARTYSANVVLIGRRALNEKVQADLQSLRTEGGQGLYLRADAADSEALTGALAEARQRFGALHGVIHSAIVLRDCSLETMSVADCDAALAPKLVGSINLAEATREDELDLFLFFSSAKSISGDPGQGNYAAASTFEDAFADDLDRRRPYPVKTVNWGYWGDLGIVADHAVKQTYARTGVDSIDVNEGIEIVKRLLASPLNQVFAIKAPQDTLQTFGGDFSREILVYPTTDDPWGPVDTAAFIAGYPIWPDQKVAFQTLDRWVRCSVFGILRESGLWSEPGLQHTLDQVITKLDVIPVYRRFLQAVIEMAVRQELLVEVGESWVLGPAAMHTMDRLAQKGELMIDHPELSPFFELLDRCLSVLPDVLCGAADPADALFPNGKTRLVERIYRGSRQADFFNDLSAEFARAAVALRLTKRGPDRPVRLLEFGAGTGGTSAAVLDALSGHGERVIYTYTDVSQAFLAHGRERFDHPFLRFEILDIERNPLDQGFEPGSQDVLIGANVLHVARDVRAALQRLKRLLTPGGVLLLNEVTGLLDFSTTTFGLLEGWWRFEDSLRIPHAPILTGEGWQTLLREEGFHTVRLLGPRDGATIYPSQAIIAAISDGVVEVPQQTRMVAPTVAKAVEPPSPERPEWVAADGGAKGDIERFLKGALVDHLDIPQHKIDRARAFSEYGVDSVTGIGLINAVNAHFGATFRTTVVFDYPTVEKLAAFIAENLPEQELIPLSEEAPRETSEAAGDDDFDQILNDLATGTRSVEEVDALTYMA